ncbi:thioredoxin family protein [Nereida sp. MMG025]|uniref:thioredoxin family protein n=1 Tax=Nereida sp. MMG025 TaxID=2909981 RepID=UPI001F231690|nr:thioredoxin family protein [Nereida sp. MMG025]MCF6444875.1 thioredoxin family protein [Nereida sp. MMG025]
MNRRAFLTTTAAAALLPTLAWAFTDYTDGAIEAALAEGKTVFVDYSATWCSTCARQGRVITQLREENAAYDENLVFIKVDWDTYKNAAVTTFRDIPRRSTLIVLKGDQELGRIVAGTSVAQIKELMDTGLSAATS